MKKLFTLLLLLVGGVTLVQAATEYDLWVGEVMVTSSNRSNIKGSNIKSGTASYNPDTKTLTLKNTTITSPGYCLQSSIDGLKVVIDGTVELKSTGTYTNTVWIDQNTTFSGKDFNSSLWVYNQSEKTSSDTYYIAIYATGGKELTFENLWVYINTTYSALLGRRNGLYSTLNLRTSFLSINESKSGSPFSCIEGFEKVTTAGVTFNYDGSTYNTTQRALLNSSGSKVTSHTCYPRFAIGRYIFNPKSDATITSSSTGSGITSGTISWNSATEQLTLSNVVLKPASSFTGINYHGLDHAADLKIQLSGTNSITTAQSGNCIYSYNRNMEITGSSSRPKLTATSAGSHGIAITGSKTLKLNSVELDVSGAYHGIYGYGTAALDINNCKIKTVTTNTGTNYGGIGGFTEATLTNDDVATAYSCYRPSLKGFGNASSLSKTVEIDVPTTYYGVYVLGHQITNVNPTKFGIVGYTSSNRGIQLDVTNKKLIIEDATLTSTSASVQAIEITKSNVVNTIVLSGTNKFTVNGNCFWIHANANDVTMTTEADQGSKESVFTSNGYSTTAYLEKNLTIDAGQRITFQSGTNYAFACDLDYTPTVTIKQKSYDCSYVNLKGGNGCLKGVALTLDKMDFYYNGGTDQTPGCYYDSSAKQIKQNGGTVVKNQNVQITGYQKNYGLVVGGTIVNEVNYGAIGSPCITSGPTSVKYSNSTKTLTLNNATIIGDESHVALRNNSVSELTVSCTGANTVKELTGNYVAMNLYDDTSLTGNGSLATNAIVVSSNTTLYIDNLNVDVTRNIMAYINGVTSTNAILNVNLTTQGKKVTAGNNVYGFTNVNLQNGTKITKPEGGYYDNTKKYVVTASGTNAYGVVFADKTATAIDAVEVEQNTDVKTIFDASGRQSETARPGLNIIRMSDGTVRKVMVK